MEKKVCYDHFSDEFYDFVRTNGVCRECGKKGTVTKFINRHGRIMSKCNRFTCGCEIWVGVYQDAYKGFLGAAYVPGIQFASAGDGPQRTKFVDK